MLKRHLDHRFQDLIEDRLDAAERIRVRAHLSVCGRCRERYEALRTSHEALLSLPVARLGDERAAKIRAAIAERRRQSRRTEAVPWGTRIAWRFLAPVAALLLIAVGVSLTPRLQAAPEWSQWRGPARDGKSPETGLLQVWPEDGPPLAWEAEGLGRGFASVSVSHGRLFTMGELDDGQYVIALSGERGHRLWKTRVGPAREDPLIGPRATPTVDGRRVYAMSTEGVIVCLDAATGSLLWRHDLVAEYGGRVMKRRGGSYDFRFSESPLVDGDLVVVTPGAPGAALVAFDKKSGAELWRTVVPELGTHGSDGAGYSSAVISEGAGVRQYVQLLGRGLIGVEASTGRFLWGYNDVANNVANIPTPIASGDYVFAANGYDAGAVLLELVPQAGGVAAREVYHLGADVLENHHGGLILHDGYIYTGTGRNRGKPVCLELETGEVTWGPAENRGRQSAAIAYADGRLYFRYQDGRVLLIEATPEGYREHGAFRLPGVRRESWPHPVIAGGKLYLREQDKLFTYDVSAPG